MRRPRWGRSAGGSSAPRGWAPRRRARPSWRHSGRGAWHAPGGPRLRDLASRTRRRARALGDLRGAGCAADVFLHCATYPPDATYRNVRTTVGMYRSLTVHGLYPACLSVEPPQPRLKSRHPSSAVSQGVCIVEHAPVQASEPVCLFQVRTLTDPHVCGWRKHLRSECMPSARIVNYSCRTTSLGRSGQEKQCKNNSMGQSCATNLEWANSVP